MQMIIWRFLLKQYAHIHFYFYASSKYLSRRFQCLYSKIERNLHNFLHNFSLNTVEKSFQTTNSKLNVNAMLNFT